MALIKHDKKEPHVYNAGTEKCPQVRAIGEDHVTNQVMGVT